MRVVDLGSGAGDVCMLLAEMVGLSGTVIGLDLNENVLLHARERAAAAGFANITFAHSDFVHYVPNAPLDAIVGRLVRMYQADPAASLAKLATYLRPGGVVAFIEPWFQPPPGPHLVTEIMAAEHGWSTLAKRKPLRLGSLASGLLILRIPMRPE